MGDHFGIYDMFSAVYNFIACGPCERVDAGEIDFGDQEGMAKVFEVPSCLEKLGDVTQRRKFPWQVMPKISEYFDVLDFSHFRVTCRELSSTKVFVEHMAAVTQRRPDTYLACHHLRGDVLPEGTDLYQSLVYPHLGKVKLFRMESLDGYREMQIDEQLRASCEGFRSLFHPAALGHWWQANPRAVRAVMDAVATLAQHAEHAEHSSGLWQLTFDVMLLCFTCIHDTDFKAQCAEQVLTWLAMDCFSNDADYFYGCRCLVYCQPFPHLYDMHSNVLQRIVCNTRRAKQGVRCYTRQTAQTAMHMWKLGHTWWAFYVFDHIDAALEDSVMKNMKNMWNWASASAMSAV